MDLRRVMHAVWYTPGLNGRMGLPILFEGPPGSGKTSQLQQVARTCALHLEAIIASLREPSDFLGLPIPDGRVTHYSPPSWAAKVAAMGHAVVFLDELNTAPPAVQAALLRVVNEGVVGDLVLPPGIRFVAAQNATEEAAGGWDLAAPLANRFGHFSWEVPDAETWGDFILGGGTGDAGATVKDPAVEEARVMAAIPGPLAKAAGLVTGFIRKRPGLLHAQPKSGDAKASRAWPSPRTWDMAIRAAAGAEVHGLTTSETDELLSAFVGVGAASEFCHYMQEADLPEPADVLDGKVKFEPDDRLDRTMAVLSSCAALVTPEKATKRVERATKLWLIAGEIGRSTTDVIVPAARALVKARLSSMAEARPVMTRMEPVMRAAGMLR